jgi:spore maturation protein CgeB
VPFINYYPDNPYRGVPLNPRKTSAQRRDLIDVLREYSHVWTWEPALASRLQADRVAASYLPFGVDDTKFRVIAGRRAGMCVECGASHDVVFVGQHSDKREAHVAAVHRHTVSLWGSRWTRAAAAFAGRHRMHTSSAFGAACAALYGTADVSLNIVDDLNMPGHNMRTFEIPGSGGVMLSCFTAEQAAIFAPDEAAVYYREPAELDDAIARLRSDDTFRERVRRNASAVAAEHTYVHRAAAIQTALGLSS